MVAAVDMAVVMTQAVAQADRADTDQTQAKLRQVLVALVTAMRETRSAC